MQIILFTYPKKPVDNLICEIVYKYTTFGTMEATSNARIGVEVIKKVKRHIIDTDETVLAFLNRAALTQIKLDKLKKKEDGKQNKSGRDK